MIMEDLMLDAMYAVSGQRAGTDHVVTRSDVAAVENRQRMERAG